MDVSKMKRIMLSGVNFIEVIAKVRDAIDEGLKEKWRKRRGRTSRIMTVLRNGKFEIIVPINNHPLMSYGEDIHITIYETIIGADIEIECKMVQVVKWGIPKSEEKKWHKYLKGVFKDECKRND